MADQIHHKKTQLFIFLFTDKLTPAEIRQYMQQSINKLGSLASKYLKTQLVKAESDHLERFKKNLENDQRHELMLIRLASVNKELAKGLYLNNTIQRYGQLDNDLEQLSRFQSEVGKELLTESVKTQASSYFITQLQLVITIILGLIIMILVITGKQVRIKQDKYKLN